MEQLQLTVDATSSQCTVVHVAGELDAVTVGELTRCIRAVDTGTVVLDLAQMTFLDSMGIGALMILHRELELAVRVLRLRNVQHQPQRVLHMTAVLEVLHLD